MNLKIKKVTEIKPNRFSLILEKPQDFSFYPGQYLDVTLPIQDLDKRGGVRGFTIASSPTEPFLQITSKNGISDFKKYMQRLKSDDQISVTHPAGTFILDETEEAIFIAGGIGITPFRSMIKYAVDNNLNLQITLIYSNSDENFLFKKELDKWQGKLASFKIIYHNSSESGRLNKDIILPILKLLSSNSIFYIAGSHSFVNTLEQILLDLEVDPITIRYDRFDGY